MTRRARAASHAPDPPTVPELLLAPQLAAIILVQLALDVAVSALVAEHPMLVDDVARQRDADPTGSLAHSICRRSGVLQHSLPPLQTRRSRRCALDRPD